MVNKPQANQGARGDGDDLVPGPKGGPSGPAGADEPMLAQGGKPRRTGAAPRMGMGETVIKALIRSIASSLGRATVRTITKRMR